MQLALALRKLLPQPREQRRLQMVLLAQCNLKLAQLVKRKLLLPPRLTRRKLPLPLVLRKMQLVLQLAQRKSRQVLRMSPLGPHRLEQVQLVLRKLQM